MRSVISLTSRKDFKNVYICIVLPWFTTELLLKHKWQTFKNLSDGNAGGKRNLFLMRYILNSICESSVFKF